MARLRCDLFSESLGLSTSVTLVLPDASEEPPPVLYLLHGLSDDDTTWTRQTSIERYVATRGLAVVMPAAARSFYADERDGLAYGTWIGEELPAVIARLLRVSTRREDTFAAGLSMGGYGAIELGLQHPERFAAVASLSGSLDFASRDLTEHERPDPRMWSRVFGDRVPADADLLDLIARADPTALPALWVGCGTADELYRDSLRFVDACGSRGIPVTTSWIEGGDHEWGLWDRQIQEVLDWLPLRA